MVELRAVIRDWLVREHHFVFHKTLKAIGFRIVGVDAGDDRLCCVTVSAYVSVASVSITDVRGRKRRLDYNGPRLFDVIAGVAATGEVDGTDEGEDDSGTLMAKVLSRIY